MDAERTEVHISATMEVMTETAQDVFKRLLRDVVAPELRRQGLRGSGSAYVLPDAAFWAQVGFHAFIEMD